MNPARVTLPALLRRPAAVAVAVCLAVILAACGSDGASPGAAATVNGVAAVHNDTDVAFITDMTPHHTGAIEMAELAATRAADQHVKDLAVKIAAAQGPEQQRMAAMAAAWGVSAPPTDGAMHGEGHSGMSMPDDAAALSGLRGAAFDKEFLVRMTAHHQGALPMARSELDRGSNPQAKQLAQEITDAQMAEISQMQQLLTGI